MIITIDGPAGTGKSSVALAVADRLGFGFLDTGAMYRAIALEAIRRKANLQDARELAFIARHAHIAFDWSQHPPALILNGERASKQLRSGETSQAASHVAVVPAVRELLVQQQHQVAEDRGDIVTEGRDQGTVVFPDARCKVYLDATPAERARRRIAQLRARGEIHDFNEVLREIVERDQRDSSRAVGPLSIPPGATVIDTTALTQSQVVDAIVSIAQREAR
jgi:cytidylate kinase